MHKLNSLLINALSAIHSSLSIPSLNLQFKETFCIIELDNRNLTILLLYVETLSDINDSLLSQGEISIKRVRLAITEIIIRSSLLFFRQNLIRISSLTLSTT